MTKKFLNYTVSMYYEVYIGSKYYHGLKPLTYVSDIKLRAGQIVLVPLKSRTSFGIVSSKVPQPDFTCAPIKESYELYVPLTQLNLLKWFTSYYPAPLGSVVDLFLPKLLRKAVAASSQIQPTSTKIEKESLPPLTSEQSRILTRLNNIHGPVILHGRTGSGKTRIYLERMLLTLESERSAIILAPEIGLTKHLEKRFLEVLPASRVVVLHSHLTDKQRREAWIRIQSSKVPLLVIGARSALFAPLKNIGLIVVDEFHDTAYKQEQQPFYVATRVAAKLAAISNAQLILGSATPPIADYASFNSRKLPILTMNELAMNTQVSETKKIFIDLSDTQLFTRSTHLSTALLDSIHSSLDKQEQSLIFLNRRGSARIVACNKCGWRATCPNCDIGQTYHGDRHKLMCHSCGLQQAAPNFCPECHYEDLIFTVAGTKTLEAELTKLFPQARIQRLDRDTEKDKRIEKTIDEIEAGKVDILVGTQGIVKGFDLPKLSTVGIIYADASLQIADYSASERTFQLITQVAGRLGRGHKHGRLVIQTYNPDSNLLNWALNGNYDALMEQELKNRKTFGYPPYQYTMKVMAKRSTAQSARDTLIELNHRLAKNKGFYMGEPAPSYPERVGGSFRWQVIVKAKSRQKLVQLAKQLPKNYSYDLDPNSLL